MFPEIDDPEVGRMRFTNSAVKLSETPPEIKSPAPKLGQHNAEIYGSLLGYSREKLADLSQNGII